MPGERSWRLQPLKARYHDKSIKKREIFILRGTFTLVIRFNSWSSSTSLNFLKQNQTCCVYYSEGDLYEFRFDHRFCINLQWKWIWYVIWNTRIAVMRDKTTTRDSKVYQQTKVVGPLTAKMALLLIKFMKYGSYNFCYMNN